MNYREIINIAFPIFVGFALLTSLFPSYEFGNEVIRTLTERRIYFSIASDLPMVAF